MFCSKCGAEVKKDSKFCAYCGNDLSAQEEKIKKQTKKKDEGVKEEVKEEVKEVKPEVKEEKKQEEKVTYTQPSTPTPTTTDGKATASLVLGICSFVLFCLMFPLSLIGLILGIASRERSGKRTAGIIINAIALALSLIASLIFVLPFFMYDSSSTRTSNNFFDQLEKELEKEISKDTKVVGNSKYGYVEVPKKWRDYRDDDAPNTLQYTDIGEYGYIVTLSVFEQDITPYQASTNIYNSIKNEGITPTRTYTKFGNQWGYKVSAYYADENKYLDTYLFKASDSKLHYIAIEGPNKYSDNFKIPETFTMTR